MPPRRQARDPSTDLGAFLGQQLKELRMEAGFRSQDAFAPVLNRDRSVLGKAESGEYPPAEDVMADWMDQCQVTGRLRDVLEGLNRIARVNYGPVKAWVAPWFETEARAHTLRYWAPVLVPGLVQTPAYARELFVAMGLDEAKVAEFVEVRLGRQTIIECPDPPDITIVLWEPVLHHQIGSRQIMREQIGRLVDLSYLPTMMIHILPSSIGANSGLGGAINLAASDDEPELLLSDGLVEDQLSQDPVMVRKARATFNIVRADAFNRADSRSTLKEAMERWSD
jgi:Domain of unknown function (DUF5753)/Helix-turn-helix domain